jgi:hypothetical protein
MSPAKTKAAAAPDDAADESLKRLGGGRWQTRDERFTIEPQSGTWAVVDATETDDFGLPLVRGPFKSLTEAKAAIAAARSNEPPSLGRSRPRRARPPAPIDRHGARHRRERDPSVRRRHRRRRSPRSRRSRAGSATCRRQNADAPGG